MRCRRLEGLVLVLVLSAACGRVTRPCSTDAECEAGQVCDRRWLLCVLSEGPSDAGDAGGAGADAGCGQDGGACLPDDASLLRLDVGLAALRPLPLPFSPDAHDYLLLVPPGAPTLLLTPAVAHPAEATIAVEGAVVPSGSAVGASLLGVPRDLTVRVTARSGRSQDYRLHLRSDFTPRAYLKPSNQGGTAPQLGASLALSADGSTLAVGAPGEASAATGVAGDQSDTSAPGAGAVYVFVRAGPGWVQQAYLKASNTEARSGFGTAVALSGDGATLVVGAPYEDGGAGRYSGAAYVFTRGGGTWAQRGYLKASNAGPDDTFGVSVAISASGEVVVVGAPGESSCATTCPASGAVYAFGRSGQAWAQQAFLKAPSPGPVALFGCCGLALSADGTTLAVAAPGEASSATAPAPIGRQGAIHVLVRHDFAWTPEASLQAPYPGTWLGGSLALDAAGSTLAASHAEAPFTSGAVTVYRRLPGAWEVEMTVRPSHRGNLTSFGIPGLGIGMGPAVALSALGDVLAVGDLTEASAASGVDADPTQGSLPETGAAFVFRRGAWGWIQALFLKAQVVRSQDHFGQAVALAADGRTLVVGAADDASPSVGVGGAGTGSSAPGRGAAHVFEW